MVAALFAAVSIAFPPEGARLPHLERCYVMGAADAGEENCELRIANYKCRVKTGKTGAWATVIDVMPGTNVVEAGGTRRTFIVEPSKPPKPYPKLEYAADQAKPHPDGECAAWDVARRPSIAAAIADGIADWVAGK